MSSSECETRVLKSRCPNKQSFGSEWKSSMTLKENAVETNPETKTVSIKSTASRIEMNTKQGFRKPTYRCPHCQKGLQPANSNLDIPNLDGPILNSKLSTLVLSLISQNQSLKKSIEINSKAHLFKVESLEDQIQELKAS